MNQLTQRVAVHIFHRDEVGAVVLTNLVNVRDVRMIEGRCCCCFLFESAHPIVVGDNVGGQNFQSNFAMKLSVLGQVHFTHPTRAKLRADFVTAEFGAGGKRHLKSRIKITSLVCVPRERASCLPSREKSNQKIWSVLKSVNCTGLPPSNGSDQMLETPLMVSMYVRARPSGVQRRPASLVKLDRGRSSTLIGSPPAKGMMATLVSVFC